MPLLRYNQVALQQRGDKQLTSSRRNTMTRTGRRIIAVVAIAIATFAAAQATPSAHLSAQASAHIVSPCGHGME